MTEQEIAERAETCRQRLREFLDALGSRLGAENDIADVAVLDSIAKDHGFFIATIEEKQT